MMFINNCKGTPLEVVQRSEAPNDAWRNLESHYRAKGTREILRLLHDFDGKPMHPEENPFQFIMATDRLAADLHKLGDRSVTELRKCVMIVTGLSSDFEIEVRMVGNRY